MLRCVRAQEKRRYVSEANTYLPKALTLMKNTKRIVTYNSDAARFLSLVNPTRKAKRTKAQYRQQHLRSTQKQADDLDELMDYAIWKDSKND